MRRGPAKRGEAAPQRGDGAAPPVAVARGIDTLLKLAFYAGVVLVIAYSLAPRDMLPTIAATLHGGGDAGAAAPSASRPWTLPTAAQVDRFFRVSREGVLTALAEGSGVEHFMAYVVLAFVGFAGHRTAAAVPVLTAGLLVVGAATEVIQLLVPHRNAHVTTIVVNWLGVGAGLLIGRAVMRSRPAR